MMRPAAGSALLAALLAVAAPGSGLWGQAPTRLTLDEALLLAEANNPAHRRALNDRELTGLDTRDFWLGLLPTPRVDLLTTQMQWNRQSVGLDNFGNPIPNPDFRMIQSASSQQRASLAFQLNAQDFFQRRTDRLVGESREVAAQQSAQALASEVRLAYLDAQERLQFQDLEVTLLSMRRVNFQITEDRFRLALVDRPELLNAEIDLLDQEQRLEQSRTDLRSELFRLRNLIGDPSLGEIEIVPAPLRVFDPGGLDQESIVETALVSGPRVLQGELGLRQAESRVWVERALWMPTLSLSASTSRQELSRESGSGFFRPLPDGEWSRTISLGLAFPDLGQYFGRQVQSRRTDLNIRNAEEALRETRFAVEEEVQSLLMQLSSAYGTILIQERRADLAEERLMLEQERYRLGLGAVDYLTLQNGSETAASAQRQALEARYSFERALIQLERSLGSAIQIPAGQASAGRAPAGGSAGAN